MTNNQIKAQRGLYSYRSAAYAKVIRIFFWTGFRHSVCRFRVRLALDERRPPAVLCALVTHGCLENRKDRKTTKERGIIELMYLVNSYKVNLGLQKNRNEYNLQDGDHVIPIDPKNDYQHWIYFPSSYHHLCK